MPVINLKVPRRDWNTLQLAADLHGVQVWPELPKEDGETFVQVTGPLAHIFRVAYRTPVTTRFIGVQTLADRDPEPERMF